MNNILVTCGAWFIGSNIVSSLIEEGYRVTVLNNFSSGYSCNIEDYPQVKIIDGDLRDVGAVSSHQVGCRGNPSGGFCGKQAIN